MSDPSRPLRILIVDDHEDSAHAVALLLRRAGHEVTCAHTVAGAVALGTGRVVPDLLLCDVELPDGNGCDLLRRLRASRGGRELPAIAITGHADEWEQRCRHAGYRGFMTKPVEFAEVLTTVAAVMRDGDGAG